jgi:3-hydroxyisobutyrate dehydrogenase-like beta-hydroxyacid dehydrogenase
MKTRISVLGMGRMGSALARAFLKQGYETTVWNRTKSKCEPLSTLGARIASTVPDAVAAAEIIVVNVSDYVTGDALMRPDNIASALRGKLLVQLTSGSPRQARETAAWAQQHGIQYLDGAIMATPNLIGEPDCTILYSGPSDLFENYKPVLLALGGNAVHVGSDVGHASALDSALLAVMWGALFGMLQGVAICEAEELRLDAYISYLKPILPQVDGWVIDTVKRIEDRRFAGDEETLATVDSHYGALQHLLELCKERGIKRVVPEAFDELFQAVINAGHGQDDFAVLNKFMR